MMDIKELKNLSRNAYIKEKTEEIINDLNNKQKDNNESLYKGCQSLLEFINIKLLKDCFKVQLPDYDIIRITQEYNKFDKKLFEEMIGVNATYNMIDLYNITDLDIIEMLYRIDFVYGYILEEYGEVI